LGGGGRVGAATPVGRGQGGSEGLYLRVSGRGAKDTRQAKRVGARRGAGGGGGLGSGAEPGGPRTCPGSQEG
jgi:hypothetical protein